MKAGYSTTPRLLAKKKCIQCMAVCFHELHIHSIIIKINNCV